MFNETTIVLVFMPVVLGVCKERNLSPRDTCSALHMERHLAGNGRSSHPQQYHCKRHLRHEPVRELVSFDFTPVAAPVFVGCAIYFFLVGRRFLPKAEIQSLEQELGKEYLTEVMVTPQSTTVGLNAGSTRLGQTAGCNYCRRHPRRRADAAQRVDEIASRRPR